MDLRPGAMVGDHARLVRPLGEGGMGTVWVAHHLRLDVEVALKVISDPSLRQDPDLMERLRREARAAARISSPHVVHMYDQGTLHDGSPFVLMELLKGESLAERIEREHVIDPRIAADIVRQAATALAAAHELSIVHRDIKPDNLFLCGDPSRPFVKVLDFGIALRHGIDSPDHRLTTADRIVGTPAYMSPEMLLSASDPGPDVDFWALSVTAYEMLTGALPFEGETLGALMMCVTRGHALSARTARPTLPQAVDAFFSKALALDPATRFANGSELSDSFEVLCEETAKALRSVDDEWAETLAAEEEDIPDANPARQPLEPVQANRPGVAPIDTPPAAGTHSAAQPVLLRTVASSPALTPATMGGAATALRPHANRKRGGMRAFPGFVLVASLMMVGAGVALWRLSGDDTPKRAKKGAPKKKPKGRVVTKKKAAVLPAGMVSIPAGVYPIGCDGQPPDCLEDEGPAHQQKLASFALMQREVTRAEYALCVTANKCAPMITTEACSGSPNEPARCLSWHAADAYCAFRGARLPSELEWEAAARGAEGARFPWGDAEPSCDRAIIKSANGPGCGAGKPTAAGHAKDVSPLGIHNMAGNVREWTSSPYAAYPGGKARPVREQMLNRGGSYLMAASELAAAHRRIPDSKLTARPDLGVRCAADLTR